MKHKTSSTSKSRAHTDTDLGIKQRWHQLQLCRWKHRLHSRNQHVIITIDKIIKTIYSLWTSSFQIPFTLYLCLLSKKASSFHMLNLSLDGNNFFQRACFCTRFFKRHIAGNLDFYQPQLNPKKWKYQKSSILYLLPCI